MAILSLDASLCILLIVASANLLFASIHNFDLSTSDLQARIIADDIALALQKEKTSLDNLRSGNVEPIQEKIKKLSQCIEVQISNSEFANKPERVNPIVRNKQKPCSGDRVSQTVLVASSNEIYAATIWVYFK